MRPGGETRLRADHTKDTQTRCISPDQRSHADALARRNEGGAVIAGHAANQRQGEIFRRIDPVDRQAAEDHVAQRAAAHARDCTQNGRAKRVQPVARRYDPAGDSKQEHACMVENGEEKLDAHSKVSRAIRLDVSQRLPPMASTSA